MKLIIQIPCFNEAETIGITLAALPRQLPEFETVEWLIVDDGSVDETVEVARKHGVDHIIRHPHNMGLARSFMTGLDACLARGADVVVNTDADNQYRAGDIPLLIQPIIEGRADIVIGSRPIDTIKHFSPYKKLLQRAGSAVVRLASETNIPDAPSGFRAISKEAAQRTVVFSDYTYTLETIIQAGQKSMAVTSVPIAVNEDLRPSRLVSSIPAYIWRSIFTIMRIFVIYQPFRFFGIISALLLLSGFLLGLRFIFYNYFLGQGEGQIQSVILSGALLVMGFQALLVAFLADLMAANRKLLEDVRYKQFRADDKRKASETMNSRSIAD